MTRPSLNAPLSVLLVEADTTYVRAIRATLAASRSQVWTVEHVGGLAAADDLLASGSFDALLLDLEAPEAGLEGLRRIQARFPALPVVALTAWEPPPETLGLEALQAGAQDYIVKGEEERRLGKALRFAVERKRAQDTLRRLEKAVDTMQLGISITDTRGRIVYVNPAEAEMHGYQPSEMLGTDARLLSPRADWRPLSPEEVSALRTWKRERVRARKDGSTFPVQLTSDAVKDQAGRPLGVVTACEDISERKRAEQALRDSEERYALAVRGANDGIWDWSLRDGHLYVSARWKQMLGYEDDELAVTPEDWMARLHPEDEPRVRGKLAEHLEGRSPHFEDEHRIRHRSGRYLWVLTRGFAVRGTDGVPTRMAGAQTDVTDRRAHDALTGLPNRALLAEKLEQALARYQRRMADSFAVLFVDVDHFKAVNDRLGHAAGDGLLMELGRRLEHCLRPGDVVGRLAGDEFCLLIDRIEDVDEAIQVAERVQAALREPFCWDGYPLQVSASIGIALSATGYETAEQILREADAAMYRAKARGRDRCEIFDAAMRERLSSRRRLGEAMQAALANDELRLAFQPIVALDDGRLLGFEALLRWDHPEGRLLAPPEVLALAEQAGQLGRVESWTLRQACREAARWSERAGEPLAVAVNLSVAQFRRPDLVDDVLAVLAECGLSPAQLWLDVTTECLVDNSVASGLMALLRASGMRVFLDDFGRGSAPLGPLVACPVDALKLDLPLVRSAEDDPPSPLLAAALAAARSLGLPVLAEGVETAGLRDRLRALGCALGQGSFFSPPVTPQEAVSMVAGGEWATPDAATARALAGFGAVGSGAPAASGRPGSSRRRRKPAAPAAGRAQAARR